MSKMHINRKNWLKKKIRTKKSLGVLGNLYRLIVFKSNKHIYGQLVDDNNNVTILSSSSIDNNINKKNIKSISKVDVSKEVGYSLAEKIEGKKINKIIFDRNGYRFHGRVKAMVDAIKEKGINI